MQEQQYLQATRLTGNDLRTVAYSKAIREMSKLSLPEIDAIVTKIASVTPAGNVPGIILNNLVSMPQRHLPVTTVKRDIRLLFRGVDQALRDRAVYSAFFAGPAAVIWAYQNLLKLAGKTPEAAFPEGVWQFYVEYALRDDTARHTCETHGFATTLQQHGLKLSTMDQLTAWAMTAVHSLHSYDALLANEWGERVAAETLSQQTRELPDAAYYTALYRLWERERPYARGEDVGGQEDFPGYRRRRFSTFLTQATPGLPENIRQAWQADLAAASESVLPAYQDQMNILAYLSPGRYSERRVELSLSELHVGIIHNGRYYLLPVCESGTAKPTPVSTVRSQIAAIWQHPAAPPDTCLTALAEVKRTAVHEVTDRLTCREEIEKLRLAPIWINADVRSQEMPLADIRRAERAAGDQPLTIFFTPKTAVFDLSHIFFDGAWGAALAEIMTNEALSWAAYLHTLPLARPGFTRPYSPALNLSKADQKHIRQAPTVAAEVSAETAAIDLVRISALRKLFKQRSDLLQLTVNDLLVLYRAIHAATYRPNPELPVQLHHLQTEATTRAAATEALAALTESYTVNPVILIPVDASRRSPADRLYPLTFTVPLKQLDILSLHQQVLAALDEVGKRKPSVKSREHFTGLQRTYLGVLAGFGEAMSQAKEIAIAGGSASAGTIKLLAHLPAPLQQLLDTIPNRFDVVNDLIKGREVFSNVGRVAPTSSLSRFITAKDDNEKKTLAWGVMTDAQGVMTVTLRDFRPHVARLTAVGHRDLAAALTRDYVERYAHGFNQYVADLYRITAPQKKKKRRWSAK